MEETETRQGACILARWALCPRIADIGHADHDALNTVYIGQAARCT